METNRCICVHNLNFFVAVISEVISCLVFSFALFHIQLVCHHINRFTFVSSGSYFQQYHC